MLKLGFNLVPNSIKALHRPLRDSTYNSQTANIPTNQNKPVNLHMISYKLPEIEGGRRALSWSIYFESNMMHLHVLYWIYICR